MSDPSHAARLIDAIDRLLELHQAFRLQERGLTLDDTAELNRRYTEVKRLALAGGFRPPPPLERAGLVNYYMPKLYPNRDAGKEWERDLQSLQTEAREAREAQEAGGWGREPAAKATSPETDPASLPAARTQAPPLARQQTDDAGAAENTKGKNVNGRMLEMLQKDVSCVNWSARKQVL
jgi:hypothetical protein